MKHRTKDLEGADLDAAVAMAEGMPWRFLETNGRPVFADLYRRCWVGEGDDKMIFRPSERWDDGGPLIQRQIIDIECIISECGDTPVGIAWMATTRGFDPQGGPTPLIAAMRAYCHSVFGDTVEIPE